MKSFEIKITGNAKSLVDSIKSSQSAMDALIKGIDKADKKLEVLTQTGSHLSDIDKQLAKLKTDYPDIFEKIFPNIDSQINESMKPILQMPELVEQTMTKVAQKMRAIDNGSLKATDDDIKELGNDMRILGETLHLENLDMSFLDGTAKAETKIKRLIDVMGKLVEAYFNVNKAAANVNVDDVVPKKKESKKSKNENKPELTVDALRKKVEEIKSLSEKVLDDDDAFDLVDKKTQSLIKMFKVSDDIAAKLEVELQDVDKSIEETMSKLEEMLGNQFPKAMGNAADAAEGAGKKIQKLLPTSEGLEKLRIVPDGDQKAKISEYAEEYRVILKLLQQGNIESKETISALRERARALKDIIQGVNPGDTTLDKMLMDSYGVSKGTANTVASAKLSSKFKIDEFKSENISNDAREKAINLIHQEIIAENKLAKKIEEERSAIDGKNSALKKSSQLIEKILLDESRSEKFLYVNTDKGTSSDIAIGTEHGLTKDQRESLLEPFGGASQFNATLHTHPEKIAAPSGKNGDLDIFLNDFDKFKKNFILAGEQLAEIDFSSLTKEQVEKIKDAFILKESDIDPMDFDNLLMKDIATLSPEISTELSKWMKMNLSSLIPDKTKENIGDEQIINDAIETYIENVCAFIKNGNIGDLSHEDFMLEMDRVATETLSTYSDNVKKGLKSIFAGNASDAFDEISGAKQSLQDELQQALQNAFIQSIKEVGLDASKIFKLYDAKNFDFETFKPKTASVQGPTTKPTESNSGNIQTEANAHKENADAINTENNAIDSNTKAMQENSNAANANAEALKKRNEENKQTEQIVSDSLDAFRALQNEILGKSAAAEGGSMDGEEIGRYTERVETAKTKLDELAKQSLLTADQIKEANDIYETAIGNLESKSRTNQEYYDNLVENVGKEPAGSYDSGWNAGYNANASENASLIESLNDEISKLKTQLNKVQSNTDSGVLIDISAELQDLEKLRTKLEEVKSAIIAKNKAFNDEGIVVGQVVGKEVNAFSTLLTRIDEVSNAITQLINNINSSSEISTGLSNVNINVNGKVEKESSSVDVSSITSAIKEAIYSKDITKAGYSKLTDFNQAFDIKHDWNTGDIDYVMSKLNGEIFDTLEEAMAEFNRAYKDLFINKNDSWDILSKEDLFSKIENNSNNDDWAKVVVDAINTQGNNIVQALKIIPSQNASDTINEAELIKAFQVVAKSVTYNTDNYGFKPRDFFQSIIDGSMTLEQDLAQAMQILGMLSNDLKATFVLADTGVNNLGVAIAENVVVPSRRAFLDETEKLAPLLDQAVDLGAAVPRILSSFNDGEKVMELQTRMSGTNLRSSKFNPEDLINATDKQIDGLLNTLEALSKVGLLPDFTGDNILFDKNKGFSLVDVGSQFEGWMPKNVDTFEGMVNYLKDYIRRLTSDSPFDGSKATLSEEQAKLFNRRLSQRAALAPEDRLVNFDTIKAQNEAQEDGGVNVKITPIMDEGAIAQVVAENVANTPVTVKINPEIDNQDSTDKDNQVTQQKTTDDSINNLESTLNSTTSAINDKTQAFENELETVQRVIPQEIQELDNLLNKINDVTGAVNAKAEAFQTIGNAASESVKQTTKPKESNKVLNTSTPVLTKKVTTSQKESFNDLLRLQKKYYGAQEALESASTSKKKSAIRKNRDELKKQYEEQLKNAKLTAEQQAKLDEKTEDHNRKIAVIRATNEDKADKNENAQNEKQVNEIYQRREDIISEIIKRQKELNSVTTEEGKAAAEEALDAATDKLRQINEEINNSGLVFDDKKLSAQNDKLANSIANANKSNFIKEQESVGKEKIAQQKKDFEELLALQKKYYDAQKALEKGVGTVKEEELVRKATEAEDLYNKKKQEVKLTQEQENQLLEKQAELERELVGIKTDKETTSAATAAKAKQDGILNAIKQEVSKSYKSTGISVLDEVPEELANTKTAYDALIDKINDYKLKGVALSDDIINGLKEEARAIKVVMDAYAEKTKQQAKSDAKQGSEKQKPAYKNSVMNSLQKKYFQSYSIATGEEFAISPSVISAAEKLKSTWEELNRLNKEIGNTKPTEAQEIAFNRLTDEFNQARKELDGIISSTRKLSEKSFGTFDLFDAEGKSEFDLTNTDDRKRALLEAVNTLSEGKAKIGEFDTAYKELNYTVKNANGNWVDMKASINAAGTAIEVVAGKTKGSTSAIGQFIDQLKSKFKSIAQYLISMAGYQEIVQQVRKGIQYVKEIDSALTELKKVTDETDATYSKFLKTMSQTGAEIGATVQDLTNMAANWARLGYSIEEAGELAKSTAVLLNVSEFTDADTAAEALISTMQAYGYAAEDSMHVVDVLNEIGNNFAISSDGIATALQDSASSLMAAGNNLEQSVAMIAAANKVLQDPNSVGSALRTISLRIRGTSVKVLEEMGEETDGVIESVSKLQAKVKGLSGVDILTDTGAYKDTYTIIKEIGQVWADMNDIDRAALLELLAGKNRSNAMAALLTNMEDLEDAYEDAMKAQGSADAENEKYMNSIQGKIDQFNNALQTMWNNALSSNFVKGIIDIGTKLIKIVDTLGLFPSIIATITGIKLGGIFLPKLWTLLANSVKTHIAALVGETAAVEALNGVKVKSSIMDATNISNDVKEAAVKAILTGEIGSETVATNLNTIAKIKAALKQKGLNDEQIAGVLSAMGLTTANTGLGASFEVLSKKIGKATIALVKFLFTNPVGWAILAAGAIAGVVAVNNKLKESEEAAAEAAVEQANSIKESNKTLDEYKTKVEELRKSLDSGNLSEEEAYNARKELISIQDELISRYGKEAEGINLVTGAIEGQIEAIDKLAVANARDWLNENSKPSGWWIFKGKSPIDKAIEQVEGVQDAFLELDNFDKPFKNAYGDNYWDQYIEAYNKFQDYVTNELGGTYIAANGEFKFSGKTREEIAETYNQMIDWLRNYAKNSGNKIDFGQFIGEITSSKDKLVGDKYDTYKANYDAYLENTAIASYTDAYGEILDAQDKFKKAYESGDKKAAQEAKTNLQNTIEAAKKEAGEDTRMVNWFDGLDDSFQAAFNDIDFDVAWETASSDLKSSVEKALKDINLGSDQEILNLGSFIDDDGKLKDGVTGFTQEQANAYNALKLKASEYGMTIDELVAKLVKLGLIQGNAFNSATNVAETVSKTVSSYEESITKVTDALSIVNEATVDGIQLTNEQGEALKELIGNEEEYSDAIDSTNGYIVKNAALLRKLITIKRADRQATIRMAKSMAQLQYRNTIRQLQQLVAKMRDEYKANGLVSVATLKTASVLREQLKAIKQTIKEYSILSLKMSEATNAYKNFEKAKEIDSQLTYGDSMMEALQVISDSFKSGDVGTESFWAAVDIVVPESAYASLDNYQDRLIAIHDYIDKNPLFADWFTIDDNEFKITQENVKNFVKDCQNAGIFTQNDENGEFFFTDSIKSIDDVVEKFNEASNGAGATKESIIAMFEALSKQDGTRGDILTDLLYPAEAGINKATTALEKAVIAKENYLKAGGEYKDGQWIAYNETRWNELCAAESKATAELNKATSAAQTNADKWVSLQTIYKSASGEMKLTAEQAKRLSEELGLVDANGNSITLTVDDNGSIQLTANQVKALNEKKKELSEPSILSVQTDYDAICAQIDELQKYIDGKLNTKESKDIKAKYNIQNQTEAQAMIDNVLNPKKNTIELEYGITKTSEEQQKGTLEKLQDWETNGMKFAVNADTEEAQKKVDDLEKDIEPEVKPTVSDGAVSSAEKKLTPLGKPIETKVKATVEKDSLKTIKKDKEDLAKKTSFKVEANPNTESFNKVKTDKADIEKDTGYDVVVTEDAVSVAQVKSTKAELEKDANVDTLFKVEPVSLQTVQQTKASVTEPAHIPVVFDNLETEEVEGIIQEVIKDEYKKISLYLDEAAKKKVKNEIANIVKDESKKISPYLDSSSVSRCQRTISSLTAPATKTITVVTNNVSTNSSNNNKNNKNNKSGRYEGTANATGNWGLPHAEHNSLVGEMGQELVVNPHTGHYYTVGDYGAELVDLPKDAIIFNHVQTEQLFKNGHINSRGQAYAEGNAHYGLFDGWTGFDNVFKNGSSEWVDAWDKTMGSLSDAADSLSGSSDDISGAVDKFEETFDWFAVLLEEIENNINLMNAQLENSIGLDSKKNVYYQILDTEYFKVKELNDGIKLYTDYSAKLLSKIPAQYREMAKNGSVAITDFVGDANQEVVEAINNYREWDSKVADLNQQLEETRNQISETRVAIQDMINTEYSNRIGLITSINDKIQDAMDLLDEQGERSSSTFYAEMIKNGNKQLKRLKEQRVKMQEELDKAVKSGDVKKFSDDWYEMVNAIYDVDASIIECETDLEGFQNSINELHWDNFEKIIDAIDNISDEAEQLRSLIDDDDIADDVGNWTTDGITSLGLLAQQMEKAKYRAELYKEKIELLNKEYAIGKYSTDEYNEKLKDLKDSQWDSIDAYESAKKAIIDVNKTRIEAVKSGIQEEIDAYDKLISKRKEDLNSQKDAHDWAKTLKEHNDEIDKIQKQIDAMSGDNSAAAIAKRKKLEAELAKAQSDLDEALYDRDIEMQQNALDKELEAYKEDKDKRIEELDKYLENEDKVLEDSLQLILSNADSIDSFLKNISEQYGVSIYDTVVDPWNDGADALAKYLEMLKAIKGEQDDLQKDADKNAKNTIDNINKSVSDTTKESYVAPSSAQHNNSSSSRNNSSSIGVGSTVTVKSSATHFAKDGGNGTRMQSWVPGSSFIVKEVSGDMVLITTPNAGSGQYTGWVYKKDLVGYAKGTKGVKNSQLATIDENGLEELVLHADGNGKLAFLSKGTSVIPADLTENLMKLGTIDPTEMLKRNTPSIGAPHITNNNMELNLEFGSLVHVDNCSQDTIPELQKMVRSEFDNMMKQINSGLKRYTR